MKNKFKNIIKQFIREREKDNLQLDGRFKQRVVENKKKKQSKRMCRTKPTLED